jgi:hypothetical protein
MVKGADGRLRGSLPQLPQVWDGILRDYQHQEERIFNSVYPRVHSRGVIPPYIITFTPHGGKYHFTQLIEIDSNKCYSIIDE